MEFDETRLVIDWNRCPVELRLLDVVRMNDLAEHVDRVGTGKADRRTCESQEHRVRECVSEVPGVSLQEAVLASVRLISDHEYVGAVAENGMIYLPLLQLEL